LRFQCDGKWLLWPSDAVPTRFFWRDRRSFYNAVNPEVRERWTIDRQDFRHRGAGTRQLLSGLSPVKASRTSKYKRFNASSRCIDP
jgi:hypothetical protein